MLCGVVEGFYGRSWTWDDRNAYVEFMASIGLNAYLYCPKSDPFLRKRWREPWPAEIGSALAGLARHYREAGLAWGVGLSPFALYENYTQADRELLRERVRQIDELGGNMLAILFDDMPGDCPDLAARQAEIVVDIQAWTAAERLLVCPTYYSFDPVLESHFGARPEAYWSELGSALPADVDLFWTGNRVCADSISAADLQAISAAFNRRPVLWDNYPVNDGAAACKHLHLAPLPHRSDDLAGAVRGHFCNPMNQAGLSRYPLSGLATLYGGEARALEAIYPDGLAGLLRRDQRLFEVRGLDGIDAEQRKSLADEYDSLGHPAAREVSSWLRGEYAFDPACLTG